jgi:hypothetical protein
MKTLQISTHTTLVPRTGGQLRSHHIARALELEGFDVERLAVNWVTDQDLKDEREPIIDVGRSEFWSSEHYRAARTWMPYLHECYFPQVVAETEALRAEFFDRVASAQPEIVLLEHPWMWPLVKQIAGVRSGNIRVIYDSQNVEEDLKRRLLADAGVMVPDGILESALEVERDLVRSAWLTVVCTQADADAFSARGAPRVLVVKNGTVRRGQVTLSGALPPPLLPKQRFVFTIGSYYGPNVGGFFKYVASALWRLPSNTRVVVAGRMCEPISDLIHDSPLEKYTTDRLLSLGMIDETVLEALIANTSAILLPIDVGGGSNVKTAEALASGRPIIATPHAFRGFAEYEHLPRVTVSATPGAFESAILAALRASSRTRHEDFEVPRELLWESTVEPLIELLRSAAPPAANHEQLVVQADTLSGRNGLSATAAHVEIGAGRSPTQGSAPASRARIIAFYLPQFHPIPENDEWWGTGFTEWTNVGKARPLFPGHIQPRLPTELGYYDLRVPETRARQAALARDYGIEGFCYWHYWFEGRRLLERPFSDVLASGEPDFPFCLGWANQSWTGVWHGAPKRILIRQTYGGVEDARRHFEAVLPAFQDVRYIRIGGMPIFVLHQPRGLPQAETFTRLWREWARAEGLPGIIFLGSEDGFWSPDESNFDGRIISNPWRIFQHRRRSGVDVLLSTYSRRSERMSEENSWHARHLSSWRNMLGWPTRFDYGEVLLHAVPPNPGAWDFPTIFPNWDNTPRSGKNGIVITGSTPERFREHVESAIRAVEPRPRERRLVFLKSWNEWAEGNFVEPDSRYGRRYLEAIQRAQYATAPAAARRP